jgi:hypothetical protein
MHAAGRKTALFLRYKKFRSRAVGRVDRVASQPGKLADGNHYGNARHADRRDESRGELVPLHRGFDGMPEQLSRLLCLNTVRVLFGRTALGGYRSLGLAS